MVVQAAETRGILSRQGTARRPFATNDKVVSSSDERQRYYAAASKVGAQASSRPISPDSRSAGKVDITSAITSWRSSGDLGNPRK